ncbi:hypothetical protein ABPG72_021439 [Tetrahymena utriculariae]
MIKGKLPSIKRFFDQDPSLVSISIPITYNDKRLIAYRNKYCKKPECIYDKLQILEKQKKTIKSQTHIPEVDDMIFWCNICLNTIDPQEFLPDEELQRIIDNTWNQMDEFNKSPNTKINCKRVKLFSDGSWEPVFFQNREGRIVRKNQTEINKAIVLPSLEN